MLVTVLGVSGLGDLPGLPTDDRTALLRLVATRPGTSHVLVLAPSHGEAAAREQAHVLVSADRRLKVCVLPLDHHGLTLSLIARHTLDGPGTEGDPSVVVHQVRLASAGSRSLLWFPRLWGLGAPTATPGQAAADLVRRTGWFLELGAEPRITSGRTSTPFAEADVVHHLPGAPDLLQTQLGGARRVEVPVEVERAPYWARTTVELTALDRVGLPDDRLPACSDCGAGLLDRQCPFCGHGPVNLLGSPGPISLSGPHAATSPPSPPPPPSYSSRGGQPARTGAMAAASPRGEVA